MQQQVPVQLVVERNFMQLDKYNAANTQKNYTRGNNNVYM